MIGGVILQMLAETCLWTNILSRHSVEVYMTVWGCDIKGWAVLFKVMPRDDNGDDDKVYQLRTSLYNIKAHFSEESGIYITRVAQNLYTVNVRSNRAIPPRQDCALGNLFHQTEKENTDRLEFCTVLSSHRLNIQPLYNRDYCVYTQQHSQPVNGWLYVFEYLKHQYVVVNVHHYRCPSTTTRFLAVIYNTDTERFRVHLTKSAHDTQRCFYCNVVRRLPSDHRRATLLFNPRYSQAILNF